MSDQIYIGVPYLEKKDDTARVCAKLKLRGRDEVLWFSVSERYGQYLVDDREDAFVAALLTTAMKEGMDIVCEAPVSRRLLYQLRHYLIPILAANLPGYQAISLSAPPADVKLSCAGAVATGWTGGADSMFTLMKTIQAKEPGLRLTHLMIANNGALEDEDNSSLLRKLIKKAETGIAAEAGLAVVGIESNIQELVNEPFLSVAAYRQAAVILALQKLFRVYYSSAAYEFSRFSFDVNNCFYFELVLFDHFRTDCTMFYSAYGAYSRAQKLKELSDYPPAWKLLHPCVYPLPLRNCGRCGKCVRTMAALYGLGTLERFSEVFDVEAFERDKDWYMAEVLAHKESQHYGEALVLMRDRGIEPSAAAKRMARTIRAAGKIVRNNEDRFFQKMREKAALRNLRFTILCNSCVGGMIYADWRMEYLSPTINLLIQPGDFVKLCRNLKYYMQKELIEETGTDEAYPVGRLDDILIRFIHSRQFEAAKNDWNRRKQRIQYDNIFVIMTNGIGMSAKDEADFDEIPYPKVMFVFHPTEKENQFYIHDYIEKSGPKSLIDWQDKQHQKRYYEQFDLVGFFNQKGTGDRNIPGKEEKADGSGEN